MFSGYLIFSGREPVRWLWDSVMLHVHRATHNLTLAVNAHGHSLVFEMFHWHCRKRATHISKTNLETGTRYVSQKPRTSRSQMVDFAHQRASHISKTNFVTCLVFEICSFICSQGTTYISKTNFATVFCTVLKVQCFSKPCPAIVVNVRTLHTSKTNFVTCLVFEIRSWHKRLFLFLLTWSVWVGFFFG